MWRVNSVMITIIKNRTKCTILLPYNKKTVFLHIGNNKHIWAKTFFSQYETAHYFSTNNGGITTAIRSWIFCQRCLFPQNKHERRTVELANQRHNG